MKDPKIKNEFILSKLLSYFIRGLIFLSPIAATVYILLVSVSWIDGLIPIGIPGLGMFLVISIIILAGYLGNTYIAKPFFILLERGFRKVPIVNFIYTSINDLIKAFFSDNKKFSEPVLVTMDREGILFKPGFVTSGDLALLGLEGKVAVYFPHSYNFSGNLFIVDSKMVSRIDGNNSDVMKYIVSGGVSGNLGNVSKPGLSE
ncbi:MAG: DUF502 domain-containing protein [Cyclobacteriaceae bacterium]